MEWNDDTGEDDGVWHLVVEKNVGRLVLGYQWGIRHVSSLPPSPPPVLPPSVLIRQQAEEKVLKRLLKKLKEEEKPPCDVTAKKELEKVLAVPSYRPSLFLSLPPSRSAFAPPRRFPWSRKTFSPSLPPSLSSSLLYSLLAYP